ncbi:hypothetical protein [Leifsonia sp. Leaf264]|uniref:hypothetical protein n=1 Tax=Leifsonia sp. Leaf264 TaxID=1736314 RepID=UPI0006F9A119|nr:hypothetical protein [Leifsonia sp. Leaf264]KQO98472.1 hypothetical protein ASF30_10445 [Leifsonia sp. Leaf264]
MIRTAAITLSTAPGLVEAELEAIAQRIQRAFAGWHGIDGFANPNAKLDRWSMQIDVAFDLDVRPGHETGTALEALRTAARTAGIDVDGDPQIFDARYRVQTETIIVRPTRADTTVAYEALQGEQVITLTNDAGHILRGPVEKQGISDRFELFGRDVRILVEFDGWYFVDAGTKVVV